MEKLRGIRTDQDILKPLMIVLRLGRALSAEDIVHARSVAKGKSAHEDSAPDRNTRDELKLNLTSIRKPALASGRLLRNALLPAGRV